MVIQKITTACFVMGELPMYGIFVYSFRLLNIGQFAQLIIRLFYNFDKMRYYGANQLKCSLLIRMYTRHVIML